MIFSSGIKLFFELYSSDIFVVVKKICDGFLCVSYSRIGVEDDVSNIVRYSSVDSGL